MILGLVEQHGITLKLVAGTHGGEYHGPCPGCGGTDRFHVWPGQNDGNGSFWCRQCEKGGDAITFLMEFDGLSFPEACERVGKDLPTRVRGRTPVPPGSNDRKKSNEFFPEVKNGSPVQRWQDNARKLVTWAEDHLHRNNRPLAWLKKRGIRQDTARRFHLGWNPGKDGKDLFRPREHWGLDTIIKSNGQKKKLWIPRGLIIPTFRGDEMVLRIRIRRAEKRGPRYFVLPGSQSPMWVLHPGSRVMVVVESELDAILVDQEAGDLAGVVALGSSSAKPDSEAFTALESAHIVLVALDYDDAGAKAAAWWEEHLSQSERWPVSAGGDPGEAFEAGVDIRQWVQAGLPPGWRVGPSGQSQKKGGRGPKKASTQENAIGDEPQWVREDVPIADEPDTPKIPQGVVPAIHQLAELLKRHPVSIEISAKRYRLRYSDDWMRDNWDDFKQISELVFLNDQVLAYLSGHPDRLITWKNIFSGGTGYGAK